MSAFHRVHGRCPACGSTGTLFVADGGHVTCSLDRCPDPGKLADLLDRPAYHVLEVDERGGWALQHEITCFPALLDCPVHLAFDRTFVAAIAGRYQVVGSPPSLKPLASEVRT